MEIRAIGKAIKINYQSLYQKGLVCRQQGGSVTHQGTGIEVDRGEKVDGVKEKAGKVRPPQSTYSIT